MINPLRSLCLLTGFAVLVVPTGAAADKNPVVRIVTNLGTMEVELYPDKAPKTVENFLQYVKAGHYNGTIFHRVIKGFMIQGGGMGPDMRQKPTQPPVMNEADNGLKNRSGTIAMARTNDPHSATSQFFINTADNAFLDHKNKSPSGWGYTVFGMVIKGLDTMKSIEVVATGSRGGHQDVPTKDVTIEKVELAN